MARLSLRDRSGLIARAIAWPFRELALAVRDYSSPEMREIRDFEKLAQINRLGDNGYIARKTIRVVGTMFGFQALVMIGGVAAGKYSWEWLAGAVTIRSFVFMGVLSVIVGAVSADRDISTLREKYPEDPSSS